MELKNNEGGNPNNSVKNLKVNNLNYENEVRLERKEDLHSDGNSFINFFSNDKKQSGSTNFNNNDNNIINYQSIDEIIDKGGYTLLTWKIIFLASVFIFIEGFYLSYFNFILSAFQAYYNCTDVALQLISGLNFLGMGIGCIITGSFTNKITRIQLIYISLFSMSALHICLCFIREIHVFAICRFLIAVFIGILIILQLNIVTEYLPVKLRSFMLNAVWFSWGLGAVYFLMLCKIFIPDLDFVKNKSNKQQDFYGAIFQLWIVLFLLIFFSFLFLHDSPRNLILTNESEKAKKILDYYTNGKLTEQEFELIKLNLMTEGENKFYDRKLGLNEIFNKRIRVITIIMMIIFFFLAFGFFGLNTVIAEILKTLYYNKNNEHKIIQEKHPIDSLILINLTGSLGTLVGGIVSEIKSLGRKKTEIYFFSISIIFAVLSLFFLRDLNILIGISLSFFQSAFNIHITYTEEIYPTKIRDYSTGILFGTSRIGGFLSQFAYINMLKGFVFYPMYFYILDILLVIILLFYLPDDNLKALDSYIKVDNEREKTEKDD